MKRIGYVRTSTSRQHTDRQLNELKQRCDQVFIEDGVSATRLDRPVYRKAIEILCEGDELVVLSYDRAYRDVVEGLTALNELSQRNIKLVSVMQRFDPSTPDGRLFFTIILALAEWEQYILRLRTVQGLKAAIQRGKKLGRPKGRRDKKKRKVRQLSPVAEKAS